MFEVALVEPEIPNNTGNIGRTCVATGCGLHLVHPLAFDTSEKACRRAGLDYWPRLRLREHASLDAFIGTLTRPPWLFSTKATRSCFDAALRAGDTLIFGKETAGLSDEMLARWPERVVALPMVAGERSLNLAAAVCAVVYEGLRQCIARGEVGLDANGRLPGV